ncbi:hypothetical protein [Haliangium sp.]|uniref:hypothetical protein n=1 Tax=Haliangium sp. TaxID=2663208 RepID=UPI003D13AB4A
MRPDLYPPIQRRAAPEAGETISDSPFELADEAVSTESAGEGTAAEATTEAALPAEAGPQPGEGEGEAQAETGEVSDAPSQRYIVPFDRNPLAAPGERIIFRAEFTDPQPSNYEIHFSTTGGHFTSASGPTARTIAGLRSGNVDFFVPSPWNGSSTVQVVMQLRRASGGAVVQTETWNFGLKSYYPTAITQREGGGERSLPAVYTYTIGPARPSGTAPFYQHQTILERFSNWTLANIVPSDIDATYRTTHGLTSTAAISAHFLGNYAGNNGTFTVDGSDRIADRHGGHPNLSNLVSQLATPKDIEVALPQVYEAQPGTTLGSYTVTRVLKADGTTWKVKKS